ncbi:FtsH protease activity modulator HflK [Fluoribacter gormanii]|uniref:Protein HflK n=1 Tax=Fluoribacter gormanii TaxID=464 RepID=A0A377GMB6_9GAMM|nr:FtsH protease activity modulator HflK [Fluoribacter gormanii]KTD05558.1 protease subunit HflK [Fluoribacter gormanii]MCW8442658.1 FtsH protease activity modulator HflK [Fluoribacter gormanii]MCW8471133.1 FtsH protease activity modulator HflK [Fluoribacter gormanii]SIQ69443.1 protease FtsH subunit HflK [Fluoribacter gormanii]STO25733.1 Modulator of FtsH protease HflK [Fluoribacter gormanii]
MGWNEPDKGKDPWKGKNQPPDLDEALKRVHDKLKKILFGGAAKMSNEPSKKSNSALVTLIVVSIAFILWVLSGIFIVDPAEQAVILRFGKYVETVGSGPHWIPRIISSKIIMNVDRVLDYSYSGQMLTRDENLVSVSLAVQYRIGDLEDYLFNVANPEESLQQATSSALRQVVGTTTLDQMITEGREVWGNQVQDTLAKTLDLYKTGISIVNVSPQPARAPESVQDAFDDAIKAQEDEKRFKEQAYAYAAKVVPIAEGKASRIQQEAEAYSKQVVLNAQGEVSEFLALLPQYIAAPNITAERMYLETMQKVLSQTSKIIVDSKSGNLLYLPLDKLFEKPSSFPTVSAKNGKTERDESGETENLVDDREFTRPVYRQGRD